VPFRDVKKREIKKKKKPNTETWRALHVVMCYYDEKRERKKERKKDKCHSLQDKVNLMFVNRDGKSDTIPKR
jgi:hypothetical protein